MRIKPLCFMLLASTVLTGCVTSEAYMNYMTSDKGVVETSSQVRQATRAEPVLVTSENAGQISAQVSQLVRGKTISADTAVKVALMNNRGLQADYAELGISATDLVQETKLQNPKIALGASGLDGIPGRALEGLVAGNLLLLFTREQRVAMAEMAYRQAQMRAYESTLSLAAETRMAWIEAVAAFETVTYLNRAKKTADAASELAARLGRTGAMPKAAEARQHVLYAELAGQKAQARLNAELAKEKLARLMGLWGDDLRFYVPDALPSLPGHIHSRQAIEAEALGKRIDLAVAKLELEARAKSFGMGQSMRFVSDLDLIAGAELEREVEDGEKHDKLKGQFEVEFVIPVFDFGEAKMRKKELQYMQAANLLAAKAVAVRSEARSAHKAYLGQYEIAHHYRNEVLPLRELIEKEALLTYNGMITSPFDLLDDTRARLASGLLFANAKRDFWLAEASLNTAIYGGGSATVSTGQISLAADSGGKPH